MRGQRITSTTPHASLDLTVGPEPAARGRVPAHVRAGRGQTRRHEHDPRQRRQSTDKAARRRRPRPPGLVLHQQNRLTPSTPGHRPGIVAVTRQMHHRQPTQIGQPMPQLHRITRVVHHQIQTRSPHRVQDRRLLSLEVQLLRSPPGTRP